MTGSISSAAWLKRPSAVRKLSPGSRNEAGFADNILPTVLPPVALAGSLALEGSMMPQRPAAVVDDEHMLGAAGRKLPAEFVERQIRRRSPRDRGASSGRPTAR